MAASKTLFPLLFLMIILAPKVYSQNTSFSINAFTPNSLKVTYERDAFVPPDETYVRLTAVDPLSVSGDPLSNSVGRVLYKETVQFWDTGMQASFDTNITLQITPTSGIVPAEGMTFFIIPVNSTLPTGGYSDNLGIYDAVVPCSPIFAVEFDIYYQSSEYDPPYSEHIGININSQGSQNYTYVYPDIFGNRVNARVTYDAPTRKISVVAVYGSHTSTVSYVFNLKMLLPKQVQVGLSASTSLDIAYFDVYTWHFNSTMVSDVNKVEDDEAPIKKIYDI